MNNNEWNVIAKWIANQAVAAEDPGLMTSGIDERLRSYRDQHRRHLYELALSRSWERLMQMTGHRGRGVVFRLGSPSIEPQRLNALLVDWWNMTEGIPTVEAIQMFRRAGFVSDAPLPARDVLTIYRGARRIRRPHGVSWTLNEDVATAFARRRTTGTGLACVHRALVPANEVLAYIVSRDEEETVVDPRTLSKIERIA